MVYLRFSPNVTCLYDKNVQLKLEAMVPKGHRVLVTLQDITLNKYFSWGLLRGPVGAPKRVSNIKIQQDV